MKQKQRFNILFQLEFTNNSSNSNVHSNVWLYRKKNVTNSFSNKILPRETQSGTRYVFRYSSKDLWMSETHVKSRRKEVGKTQEIGI